MDGEGGVLCEKAADQPLASPPGAKKAKANREGATQKHGGLAEPELSALTGAKFDVEHMLALKAPVFGFASAPHKARNDQADRTCSTRDRVSAKSIIF